MDSFISELSRMAGVLQRSNETELDYSLKDAKRLICGLEKPPIVTLSEEDRGPMRDISMTIRWDKHTVSISLIASDRFFTMRHAPLYINGKLTDWTWDSNYGKFHIEADEPTRKAFWEFLTAITNVL